MKTIGNQVFPKSTGRQLLRYYNDLIKLAEKRIKWAEAQKAEVKKDYEV